MRIGYARVSTKPKRRPITPTGFAKELVEAASGDPGCERKCMLFYVDGKDVGFLQVRSEARCMVVELTTKGYE